MSIRTIAAIAAASITLVACGGGGGGGSSTAPVTPPTPATPAPTVTMAISQPKITLGTSATITWSSTNATSCTASDGWSGTQAISGTSAQTPNASGSLTYTLTCTGAGGTAKQSVALIVPIPVLKSSYENKIAAGQKLGSQNLPSEVTLSNSAAFADFFQDGTYSMVTHTLVYDRDKPSTAGQIGAIKFYSKVGDAWVDSTSKLLADTKGCIHPRKAIVADFNNDGKPDVFFACHGFDADPFAGEQPHVLYSQADGTYKNVTLPITCYCHSATAADLEGNGFASVLVTDNQTNATVPFFLDNDKNGGFVQNFKRLPFQPHVWSSPNLTYTMDVAYTVELIDFDSKGRYDAFVAGTEASDDPSGIAPTIFKNDGANTFLKQVVTLPTNAKYATTLDVLFDGKSIFLNRVETKGGAYGFSSIEKIDYATLKASEVYHNTANYPNGMTWLNWIIFNQGKVVSFSSSYGVAIQ